MSSQLFFVDLEFIRPEIETSPPLHTEIDHLSQSLLTSATGMVTKYSMASQAPSLRVCPPTFPQASSALSDGGLHLLLPTSSPAHGGAVFSQHVATNDFTAPSAYGFTIVLHSPTALHIFSNFVFTGCTQITHWHEYQLVPEWLGISSGARDTQAVAPIIDQLIATGPSTNLPHVHQPHSCSLIASFPPCHFPREPLTVVFTLHSFLHQQKFMYDRVDEGGERIICIITWHVDDGLAAANNRSFLAWIKGQIGERFGITDLGAVRKYLGIQFERDRATRELWMYQAYYITYLLEEHGMLDCNPVHLSMDPNHPFGRNTDLHPSIEYCKLVGELLYLAMYTRPGIAVAVMKLTHYNSSPEARHYSTAKHVLRYLAGTINIRVHYGGAAGTADLHGFSDSDWASCPEDRISITGYVWFFNGGPVSHASKKQTTHALLSTEAEYMALTAAIQEGLWGHCTLQAGSKTILGLNTLTSATTSFTRMSKLEPSHLSGSLLIRTPWISLPSVFLVLCSLVISFVFLLCLVEGVCWIQLALRTRLDYITWLVSLYLHHLP